MAQLPTPTRVPVTATRNALRNNPSGSRLSKLRGRQQRQYLASDVLRRQPLQPNPRKSKRSGRVSAPERPKRPETGRFPLQWSEGSDHVAPTLVSSGWRRSSPTRDVGVWACKRVDKGPALPPLLPLLSSLPTTERKTTDKSQTPTPFQPPNPTFPNKPKCLPVEPLDATAPTATARRVLATAETRWVRLAYTAASGPL